MNVEVNPALIRSFLFLPVLLLSFSVHEFSHAALAVYFGDDTPKKTGRFTFNPLKHLDLVGSLIVPLIGITSGGWIIGWAKPVGINRMNFRNVRMNDLLVSLAGPLANLFLALLFAIVLNSVNAKTGGMFVSLLSMSVYLNLFLFVFNLLPVPPLDGSHILLDLFPNKWVVRYLNLGYAGLIVLFLLLYTPFWNYISSVILFIFNLIVK